ncbi:hypothetical protein M6D76_04115 [Alcaligenes faecalis]|uniref:hypothetical protein n=1 Tax=Alcaligenes faecalis TaxID=511 RepID=UPI00211BEAC1|nr:hypothetical protein [Alcaligenes faecalis]UUO13070.1 hypothetical protein M6D76_04115 [Alcaligenes faecalis]
MLVPVLLERKYDLLKGEHEQWPVKRESAKFFYFSVNCALAAEKRPQWAISAVRAMGKAAVYRAVKLFLDVSYAFVQILLICRPDLETESRAAV